MKTNLDNLKYKHVLVVGMGKSGVAAAQALVKLGAVVYIQDSKKEESFSAPVVSVIKNLGVKCFFGCVPPDMSLFDMIVLSPGVSPELDFVQEGKAAGAEITGELEIAYRIGKGNYVAITGTNGKTTTTTLTGHIFEAAGRKTHIVGNIGVAVISASVNAGENDWLVTETSSFQLETTRYFKPAVGAILNLTPDHLNRHHTMEAYGNAKAMIFQNQSPDGYSVVNYDDKACFALAKNSKARIVPFSRKEELEFGAFIKDEKVIIRDDNADVEICDVADIRIIGDHNVENVLAAAAISYFAGISPEVIHKAICEFNGVAHRIEYCGTIDGVKYYNDSKGTNIDAAVTAIKAIKNNIILIAGGDAKGQIFDEFIEGFNGGVKKMILLGRDASFIKEAADRAGFTDYVTCRNMDECVKYAHDIAQEGDTVLLSPACASWDMYDNYEQRGDHFKECVARLEA